MMRRSGVSPAVKRSKLSREMLRRVASGHIPATQVLKLAAASRIALAVIRGWPEAPSSPLQGIEPAGIAPALPGDVGCCGGASDFVPEKIPNRLERPLPDCWAKAGGASRAANRPTRNRAETRANLRVKACPATCGFADMSIRGVMSPPAARNLRLS